MKLEVGMYVRTNRGNIDKILLVEYAEEKRQEYPNHPSKSYWRDKIFLSKERYWRTSQNIIKASHNIIDLIEVGDVIIDKEGHKYPINYEFETDYNNEYGSYEITIDDNITLFFKDDLSIVTKEQIKSISYEVSK